jgi:hypothetical protein
MTRNGVSMMFYRIVKSQRTTAEYALIIAEAVNRDLVPCNSV